MTVTTYVTLAVLVLLLGAQLWLRPLLVLRARQIFTGSIALLLASLLVQLRMYFVALQNGGDISRYLVPPYQSLSYFFVSGWALFLFPYITSICTALLFILILKRVPKHRLDLIFEADEPWLIATTLLLSGHPGWLLTLTGGLLLIFFGSFYQSVIKKTDRRFSAYRFWLPIAIAVVLLSPWLTKLLPWLQKIVLRLS